MNRLIIFCLLMSPFSVLGDAIVMTRAMTASTIAEVYIEKDMVRVELEIGGMDLPAHPSG